MIFSLLIVRNALQNIGVTNRKVEILQQWKWWLPVWRSGDPKGQSCCLIIETVFGFIAGQKNNEGDMFNFLFKTHYNDVIISAMASQFTSISIVYSSICSGADQRKHQSSMSLAFVRGIHCDRMCERTFTSHSWQPNYHIWYWIQQKKGSMTIDP